MGILVLNGSGRQGGNTQQLTEVALAGLPYTQIDLREKRIIPIMDQRHAVGGFGPVDDDYEEVISEVLKSDILFFATPVYWYGISGSLKNLVDRWSQSLRDSRYDFKQLMGEKQAYVITVGGDQPRIKALPMIQQLQYTFDFVGMKFSGYLIGQGSKPGDIVNDTLALAEAKCLNEQLKSKLIHLGR